MARKREDEVDGVHLELPEPVFVGIGEADWNHLLDCMPDVVKEDFVEAYPTRSSVVVIPRHIFLLLVMHAEAKRRLAMLN
jgi:hypothetical protein